MDAEAGVALAEGAQMAVGKADAAVEVTVARLMVAAEGEEVALGAARVATVVETAVAIMAGLSVTAAATMAAI